MFSLGKRSNAVFSGHYFHRCHLPALLKIASAKNIILLFKKARPHPFLCVATSWLISYVFFLLIDLQRVILPHAVINICVIACPPLCLPPLFHFSLFITVESHLNEWCLMFCIFRGGCRKWVKEIAFSDLPVINRGCFRCLVSLCPQTSCCTYNSKYDVILM